MQDIDFSKLYLNKKLRNTCPPHREAENETGPTNQLRKIMVYGFVFILAFTIGFWAGNYSVRNTDVFNELSQNDLPDEPVNHDQLNSQEEKLISRNISPAIDNKKNGDEKTEIKKEKFNNDEFKSRFQETPAKKTYLIWAKTYQDRMIAYRHAHFLKKQGFPVFLAKSGDRMKVYIGPIYGKKKGYQVLSRIKKWTPFKTAILHEKNN